MKWIHKSFLLSLLLVLLISNGVFAESDSAKNAGCNNQDDIENSSCGSDHSCSNPDEEKTKEHFLWIYAILGATVIAGLLVRNSKTRKLRVWFLVASVVVLGFYKGGSCYKVCPIGEFQNFVLDMASLYSFEDADSTDVSDSTETSGTEVQDDSNQDDEFKAPGDEFSGSSDEFKTPGDEFASSDNEFKAPGDEFSDSSDEFKAPGDEFASSDDEFKAPGNEFSGSSDNEFKAPGDEFSGSSDEFKAPGDEFASSDDEFKAPGDEFSGDDDFKDAGDEFGDQGDEIVLTEEQLQALAEIDAYLADEGGVSAVDQTEIGNTSISEEEANQMKQKYGKDAAKNRDFSFVNIFWLLLIIPITYIFGKVWCGWICHLGALQELLYLPGWFKSFKKYRILKGTLTFKIFWSLRLVLFIALIVQLLVMGSIYWCIIDPFVNIFKFNEFIQFLGNFEFGLENLIIVTLVLLVLVSSLISYRPFCRSACPVGFLLGLVSWIPGASVVGIKGECKSCRVCFTACEHDAILREGKLSTINNQECIACGDCMDACPQGGLEFLRKNKENQTIVGCKHENFC